MTPSELEQHIKSLRISIEEQIIDDFDLKRESINYKFFDIDQKRLLDGLLDIKKLPKARLWYILSLFIFLEMTLSSFYNETNNQTKQLFGEGKEVINDYGFYKNTSYRNDTLSTIVKKLEKYHFQKKISILLDGDNTKYNTGNNLLFCAIGNKGILKMQTLLNEITKARNSLAHGDTIGFLNNEFKPITKLGFNPIQRISFNANTSKAEGIKTVSNPNHLSDLPFLVDLLTENQLDGLVDKWEKQLSWLFVMLKQVRWECIYEKEWMNQYKKIYEQ
jgi:hypothetical protein